MTDESNWLAVRVYGEERLIFGKSEPIAPGTWVRIVVDGKCFTGRIVASDIPPPPIASNLLVSTLIRPLESLDDVAEVDSVHRDGFGEVGLSTISRTSAEASVSDQEYRRTWQATLHPGTRITVDNRAATGVRMMHRSTELEVRYDSEPDPVLVDVSAAISISTEEGRATV